ncbi:Transcriptional regulator, Crp/Fnr family [hydrothermal vent metagenome]|uniref:Transcriptional regulator, Crp/Fnr family n=1 Tax=hydrothermal vent metagenome TaxID=652676 RepID=A0A3B0YEC1_9ZZZZ
MNAYANKNSMLWSKIYPAFASSTEPAICNIIDNATQVEAPAGSLIISPGMLCEQYLFIVAGKARVHLLTESGREIVLYYVGAGDSCVLTTSCLLSHEPFPAGIVAETDLVAFTVRTSLFEQAIDASPRFRRFVFKKFGERLVDVVSRMEQICAPSIERYLAQTLLELSDGTAKIMTTHQELALRLGTAREVVSRHLKNFETNGWIHLGRGSIHIAAPEHLRKITT